MHPTNKTTPAASKEDSKPSAPGQDERERTLACGDGATLMRPARTIAIVMRHARAVTADLHSGDHPRVPPSVRVRHRIAGEDRPFRSPGASGSAPLGTGDPLLAHLSSLVERRSRVSSLENTEVELEHDELELRSRMAWLSERLAAGAALTAQIRPTGKRSEGWSWRLLGHESDSARMLAGGPESGDRHALLRPHRRHQRRTRVHAKAQLQAARQPRPERRRRGASRGWREAGPHCSGGWVSLRCTRGTSPGRRRRESPAPSNAVRHRAGRWLKAEHRTTLTWRGPVGLVSSSAAIPALTQRANRLGDPEQRISDAEREQAVVWLRGDLLSGRLALEEFSERIEQAYAARVRADLERVRSGLPSIGESSAGQPRRHATRLTAGLFAHVVKRGRRAPTLDSRRWRVVRYRSRSGKGGDPWAENRGVDSRDPRQRRRVRAGEHQRQRDGPGPRRPSTGMGEDLERPGAPEITVRAISVFGTVDVWRVPADMPGDYGEVTRQLQGRQRELPP